MNTLGDLFTKKSSLDNFMISKFILKSSDRQQSNYDHQYSMPSKLQMINVNSLLKADPRNKAAPGEGNYDIEFIKGMRDVFKNSKEEKRK